MEDQREVQNGLTEQSSKKSWFLQPKYLVPILIILGALGLFFRKDVVKLGKHISAPAPTAQSTVVDPCARCQPDEKSIGVDDVKDDGKIVWKWSTPCIGSEACSKCEVPAQSCTTENDTSFALKCACRLAARQQ